MNIKKLIRTKTFWTGLSAVTLGILLIINGEWRTGVPMVFGGMAMIFVRDAIK